MFRLKLQYLLAFAITGCTVPFVPLYLRQMGLTDTEVSRVMALSGLAVLLSPVLVTLIADTHLDARRIVSFLLGALGLCFIGIPTLAGFWPILLGFLVVNIVMTPIYPLQDGISFASQERAKREGKPTSGYHHIRVWGTLGFLVPGLLLYALVNRHHDVTVILYIAAAFSFLCGINALALPRLPKDEPAAQRKLPTAEAFRVLFGKPLLGFCIASFLIQMAVASYYTFYPIYLSEKVGLPRQWTGMIMNIGVALEIISMLAFGWIIRTLGPRRFLLLATSLVALRMLLLALFPIPAVAIGIQLFHGPMVLLITVAPIVLINKHAEDRFRNSLQGLYAMAIVGLGRMAGNLLVGPIAKIDYRYAFAWSTALILIALLLFALTYHPAESAEPSPTPPSPPIPDET